MIDCHTHLWRVGEHIGPFFLEEGRRAWGMRPEQIDVSPERHREAIRGVEGAIVLGFHAPYMDVVVPNDYLAAYIRTDPERLVGFASVNPAERGAREELERCFHDLGLRGLKLGPIYQNYDPVDEAAFPVYEFAERQGIPIMIHQATTFPSTGHLRYALPILLDEVAIRFPRLKIVMAHLGHPWEAECVVTVRKHPNLYTDLSALHGRPWRFYQAMITAVEYGIGDRILFGSDFPFFTPEQTAAGLRDVNAPAARSALPRVPQALIEAILERDPFRVLGLKG
jgi:predicted TIM-barrel fold metal-dependent hydrolase